MSGLGLLRHINSTESPLPVVIITGKPSKNSASFYLEKGAVGFFRKPFVNDSPWGLSASPTSSFVDLAKFRSTL